MVLWKNLPTRIFRSGPHGRWMVPATNWKLPSMAPSLPLDLVQLS